MRAHHDCIAGFERDQRFVDRGRGWIRGGKNGRDDAHGLADFDDSRFTILAQHADGRHPAHAPRQQIGREHIFREFIGGVAVSGFFDRELGKALRVIATFSGQMVQCGGKNVMVLSDGAGQVMLVGDGFFWSSQISAGVAGDVRILAEQIPDAQPSPRPTLPL